MPEQEPIKAGRRRVRELPKITTTTDTRDILAHAAKEAAPRRLFHRRRRCPCHRDRVLVGSRRPHGQRRLQADGAARSRIAAARRPACSTPRPVMLYQDVFGRIPHQQRLGRGGARRAHPRAGDAGAARHGSAWASTTWWCSRRRCWCSACIRRPIWRSSIGNAYNRWLVEEILPQDPRIKAMLYLPFNQPEACVEGGRSGSPMRPA